MTAMIPITTIEPAHSSYGFSAQSRIMVCGGSVPRSKGLPNSTNPSAELGTAVHELVEAALILGVNCDDFIGCTFNDHVIDSSMAEGGQVYVAYVRQILAQRPNAKLYLEIKVCISSISGELWGTSDVVIVDGDTLIVGDYKNGYGLVEVHKPQVITGFATLLGNAQTVGYALATMDTLQLWGKINKVINFIAQPNGQHAEGVIRSHEYNMDEMTQWHHAYRASHGRTDIVAGKHCVYCLANGRCGANIMNLLSHVGLDNTVELLNDDQVIAMLNLSQTFKQTMKAVESQALIAARKGKQLKDWKLVKAIVHGFCTDEEKFVEQAVEQAVESGDISHLEVDSFTAQLYNKPKLKGMTANKKVVDKKLVDKFYDKPPQATVLVPITDKRAAIMPDQRPSAVGKFKPIGS